MKRDVVAAVRQSAANLHSDVSGALPRRRYAGGIFLACAWILATFPGCSTDSSRSSTALLQPHDLALNGRAPELFRVRLETSKGPIVIEVHRDWAPHGADRFYNLVRAGYYDDSRFFRVIQGRWAQFGINGDPKISTAWRARPIPDDPRVESNVRGTVAFAFAVANGRTTQVFINLKDNSATHDREPFVPFGKVIQGMEVADALNSEYGESAGSGIRSGKQGPLFEEGNAWLERYFPRLDYIVKATVLKPRAGGSPETAQPGSTTNLRRRMHNPVAQVSKPAGFGDFPVARLQKLGTGKSRELADRNVCATVALSDCAPLERRSFIALALPAGWELPFPCSKQLRRNHTTYS